MTVRPLPGEKGVKTREVPPVNLQSKAGASRRQGAHLELQCNSSSLLKDLHGSSHRSKGTCSTTKNCTKDGRAVCMHGESHSSPQMSFIQEGFVLRKDLSPQRFHLVSVAKCSCPQHRTLQSLLKAATKSNSLARENVKEQGTQRHLPSLPL